MTDKEIIQKIIEHDDRVTEEFFYKYYKKVFLSVIRHVFDYEVDYDECINEFYLFLMADNCKRLWNLRLEHDYSLNNWLWKTAYDFFKKNRDKLIENQSNEPQSVIDEPRSDPYTYIENKIDVERWLLRMPNQEYAYIIRKLVLEDMNPVVLASELGIKRSNLDNKKRRAIMQLTKVAFRDFKNNEK